MVELGCGAALFAGLYNHLHPLRLACSTIMHSSVALQTVRLISILRINSESNIPFREVFIEGE